MGLEGTAIVCKCSKLFDWDCHRDGLYDDNIGDDERKQIYADCICVSVHFGQYNYFSNSLGLEKESVSDESDEDGEDDVSDPYTQRYGNGLIHLSGCTVGCVLRQLNECDVDDDIGTPFVFWLKKQDPTHFFHIHLDDGFCGFPSSTKKGCCSVESEQKISDEKQMSCDQEKQKKRLIELTFTGVTDAQYQQLGEKIDKMFKEMK